MSAVSSRILPFVVSASLAASCGGSSGKTGAEAGVDGRTSKEDAGLHDGHASDGPRSDSKASDAAGDGPSGDAGSECHQLQGRGSTLSCTSTSVSSICAESGHQPGPCPSAGLAGCCIFSSGNTVCFYSSDSVPASQEKTTCKSGGGAWVTSAP